LPRTPFFLGPALVRDNNSSLLNALCVCMYVYVLGGGGAYEESSCPSVYLIPHLFVIFSDTFCIAHSYCLISQHDVVETSDMPIFLASSRGSSLLGAVTMATIYVKRSPSGLSELAAEVSIKQ
jgi:hypothetical protein